MSSNFGAISPLMDRIQALRKMGGQAVDTLAKPGEMLQHMISPAPAPPPVDTSWHDQMVRDANASHVAAQPNLSTMKKPLGR